MPIRDRRNQRSPRLQDRISSVWYARPIVQAAFSPAEQVGRSMLWWCPYPSFQSDHDVYIIAQHNTFENRLARVARKTDIDERPFTPPPAGADRAPGS